MAGDWIKVERATLHKPEILEAAELLGMDRRKALGLFLDYFAWLDENMPDSCNGFVTHVSRKSVDEALHEPGFAAVLERIGWAKFDDSARTLVVINPERHNGSTAKTRALNSDRQKRFRNASITLDALPEKRREEKRLKSKTLSSSQANIDEARVLLNFLNQKAGRFFRDTPKTLEPILGRLREGNTVSDCKALIVRRWLDWKDKPDMRRFMRPETLFNATKFAQYMGDVPTEEPNANENMS